MFGSILAGKPRPAGGELQFSGTLSPDAVTADFVYIRFHGRLKSPYRGPYPDEFLKGWAEKIRSWMKAVKAVFWSISTTQWKAMP